MKKLLGLVGVEGGTLLIIDPSNASEPYIYALSGWATLCTDSGAGEFNSTTSRGEFSQAVAFGGFGGDGVFEVWGNYGKKGELRSIHIDLENNLWFTNEVKTPTEEEWAETLKKREENITTFNDHMIAHEKVVECAQTRINKGLPCICGKHPSK